MKLFTKSLLILSSLFSLNGCFEGNEKTLLPINEVTRIVITYSGSSKSDETKDFFVSEATEIEKIYGLLPDKKFPNFPLLNSEKIDFTKNWFVSIFYKNGDAFYIYVDKKNVSNYTIKEAPIFEYLNKKYT